MFKRFIPAGWDLSDIVEQNPFCCILQCIIYCRKCKFMVESSKTPFNRVGQKPEKMNEPVKSEYPKEESAYYYDDAYGYTEYDKLNDKAEDDEEE